MTSWWEAKLLKDVIWNSVSFIRDVKIALSHDVMQQECNNERLFWPKNLMYNQFSYYRFQSVAHSIKENPSEYYSLNV